MKKTILFFIAILIVVSASGQLGGDGLTPGTAYYGTITNAQSWTLAYSSGTIYIGQTGNEDLTIGTGGSLIIEAGVTVKFCTTSSDLIITGTGTINANGTSSSKIIFTRNYPSVNYWGHISFQSMGSAGASVFNNCIIEYGNVSSFSIVDPHGGGGAIFIDFNNVSLTNCTFQHNKAVWGGGVFVFVSRSPSIKSCYFYDNSAVEGGGGLFCYDYASSIIENCIFYSNTCQGNSGSIYTGGGLAAQSSCSITVVNCTFVDNTSSRTDGQGLMLYASPGSKVVNSIFWGSVNQIYLAAGTPDNTIINCAIQASVPSGSVNCITLNSTNNASDGPNFTAIDGSNWSIQFPSPCRDAGISSGAPTTDILGKGRIGNYDIGAYEVQYNQWNGSASDMWSNAANWDAGVVPLNGDIVIPSGLTNYPTGDPTLGFVLGLGKYLILKPGAKATFGNIRAFGSLILESDATGISSLISNTNVTATVKMYLSGGGTKTPLTYKWHYISSPIISLPVSTFATLDLAQWIEPRPSLSLAQGWVAYDGYDYSTGGSTGITFSNLNPGQGYDYYKNADQTLTFTGQLNAGDITMNLSYTSGDDNLHGYNLVGNPFPSGLDWDYIITHSFPTNTTKSLYFTRNSTLCSYINGVGVPGDVTGIIPPMQGFFSKTTSAGNSIVLAAAARTHNNIHTTYKKGLEVIPLVRLALTDDTQSDETVVRFDNLAKSYLDNDFDAVKMFLDPGATSIYSSLSGINYSINGLPFPDPSVEIPVTVNLTTDAVSKSIAATQLQGLDNYNVTLTDNTTGFVANLKTSPTLTFAASKGNVAGRFILKISNISTGIENPIITTGKFNIYSYNNFINIQPLADDWDGKTGSITVLDLTGKVKSDSRNNEFHKNSILQVEAPAVKGMYVVEIKSGLLKYVGKVVIK